MKTETDADLHFNRVRQMAATMSQDAASNHWSRFLREQEYRDCKHSNDGRRSAGRMVPDIWSTPEQYAAGVVLGHCDQV